MLLSPRILEQYETSLIKHNMGVGATSLSLGLPEGTREPGQDSCSLHPWQGRIGEVLMPLLWSAYSGCDSR